MNKALRQVSSVVWVTTEFATEKSVKDMLNSDGGPTLRERFEEVLQVVSS